MVSKITVFLGIFSLTYPVHQACAHQLYKVKLHLDTTSLSDSLINRLGIEKHSSSELFP